MSVYAVFDQLGPDKEPKTTLYSMDELKTHTYFSLDDKRELISSRSFSFIIIGDWLDTENRLFLVHIELNKLIIQNPRRVVKFI